MKKYVVNSRLVVAGFGLALAGMAQAAFSPIPLTTDSFNEDVVVEKTATPVLKVVTTASVDQGTNNGAATWMETGFDPDNLDRGLPAPGVTFTAAENANYSFQMAPTYTAPNGILIDDVITNGTFTLTTPTAYTMLSFIASGGNGGHTVGVTVHYQDGSTQTGSFISPDWYNGSDVAWFANERVGNTRDFGLQQNDQNPRLYYRDLALDNTTSPVTSLDLYYISGNSGAHSAVMGVSGATTQGGAVTPIAVTGYTYDFVVEKEADGRGRIVSTKMDGGTNLFATTQTPENQGNDSWTFYEKGYNVNNPDGNGPAPNAAALDTGIPAAGSSVTNDLGDHIFTLPADYTTNNACYVTTGATNHTITFATPTTASVLSFLCTAGGGAATLDVVVHHEDSSTENTTLIIPDWFNTSANGVIKANGRVSVGDAVFSTATLNGDDTMRPWIDNVDILVNDGSPVTSIDVTHRDTGGQVAIFAVSGSTEPVAPVFVVNPQQNQKASVGDTVDFTAVAVANVPNSYQWQVGTNGVFVDLANGAGVSGATTTNLTLTSVADADYPTYRCVVTNSAGSAISGTADLLVISALQDVTLAGDPVQVYAPDTTRGYPSAESPPHAIDDYMSKYLHFGNNPIGRLGFTVAPSQGRSIVSAMRLYTANDDARRDPANVILEGSNDGGASWTMIYSNSITMPDGRNTDGTAYVDPLNQNITQVRFENTNSYTSYRWYTTQLKGDVDLMQIGEVEFLGIIDYNDPTPYFAIQPTPTAAYDESSAYLSVYANGNPFPDHQWQKDSGTGFVDLTDDSNISGSQSSYLSFNAVSFSDAGDYRCIAMNSAGAATSAVVALTVVSTNVDVTMPGDPIEEFNDNTTTNYFGDGVEPPQAIDNFNTLIYTTGGIGPSAGAGFPPFEGPVGLIVTPSAGYTLLSGLRIYTSTDSAGEDPIDYILEGSNDGGTSYQVISQGPLDLPLARGSDLYAFTPIDQPMQEILFTASSPYLTYKLTFIHTRDDANQSRLSIGEFELLGVPSGAPVEPPVLSITPDGSGGFIIDSTIAGDVYSTTNLSGGEWTLEGTTPVPVTPSPTVPEKYYQIRP